MDILLAALSRLWLPTAMVILAIMYVNENLSFPRGVVESLVLIAPVTVVMILAYVSIVVQELRAVRAERAGAEPWSFGGYLKKLAQDHQWKKMLFAACSVVYVYLIQRVGFEIPTLIFVGATMYALGARSWVGIIATTVIFTFAVAYTFTKVLLLPLPVRLL